MHRFTYILLLITFISCDNLEHKKIDGIQFQYTNHLKIERATQISRSIVDEIKANDAEKIKEIDNIKIDSAYFSIILYVAVKEKVTGETRGQLRGFAGNLSSNYLSNVPVHIIVTDNKFKPLGYLPFKIDKRWERYEFQSGTTKIILSENCEINWASNLDIIFRSKIPEVYGDRDSVMINVDLVRDTVKIDVSARPNINLDTLSSQFLKKDRIIFDLTFNQRTVLIYIRNRKTKETMKAYGVKGL